MYKKELVKGLKNELEKMQKRDDMINQLQQLDMTRYDNKDLTAHILTFIKKECKNLSASYYSVGSLKNIVVVTKPINFNYSGMSEISITFYQNEPFTVQQWKKELENWKNSSKDTLEKLQHDIDNIDQIIELNNKLVDEIKNFQEITSYKFKDLMNYKSSYNWKIKDVYQENKKHIEKIEKIAGFREKNIIKNLKSVKVKQWDKNYQVLTFISDNEDSFDYEILSNRITG